MSTERTGRMIDQDPKLGAMAALILHKLMDDLDEAMDFAREKYPAEEQLSELTTWMNGAIYGTVASFVRQHREGTTREEIDLVYGGVCEVTDELFRDGGILDTYGTEAEA